MEEEHGGFTADGHESFKSLTKKQSIKTISVAPTTEALNAISETYPSQEKRKKSVANHGFTADGLTPQSSFRYITINYFLLNILIPLILQYYIILVLMIVIQNQNLNQLQKL